MKIIISILTLLLSVVLNPVWAQKTNLGIPITYSFDKSLYKAGSQNWEITQDDRGVMYFANNEGMLEYNGSTWKLYPLPNKTILHSISIDTNGIIYVGGQNDFGFFSPNEKGNWIFHSLKTLLPSSEQNFEDVWDIVIHNNEVIFKTHNKLFIYKNGKIESLTSKGSYNFLGYLGDVLVIQDSYKGLIDLSSKKHKIIPGSKNLDLGPISAILPCENNNYIIVTLLNGVFIYDGFSFNKWAPFENFHTFFIDNRIYSATKTKKGDYIFGTARKGIFVVSKDGKIIYNLNNENGLLNNTVRSMFLDNNQHLWLGLDNGINFVLENLPFTRIIPDGKLEEAGYKLNIFNDKIYIATSNGLYYKDWKEFYNINEKGVFQEVNMSSGQVWGVSEIKNELFLCSHSGSFVLKNDTLIRNYPDFGVWLFKPLVKREDLIIAGTYHGIAIFEKQQGEWTFRNKLSGFQESSRFIEEDTYGNIWVAHPYKGVFKVIPDKNYRTAKSIKYGQSKGLKSDILNHVFKIGNEILFCSESGIYKYNLNLDTFELHEGFSELFHKDIGIRRLIESPEDDIWYVSENEIGYLKVEDESIDKSISKHYLPNFIKKQLVDNFEFIYPINDQSIFIGTEKGFIHFDAEQEIPEYNFKTIISKVSSTAGKDSIVSMGIFFEKDKIINTQTESQIPIFSHIENAIRFEFIATDYLEPSDITYQYKLEGLENDWSEWSSKAQKEYSNLSSGEYRFYVRSKNTSNLITPTEEFRFIIKPPWYFTVWAKSIFLLIGLFLIFLLGKFFWQKYYIEKEKVKASEEEIGRLKENRLELEIAHKNRELLSSTIHIQHKNEIFGKIKTTLKKMTNEVKSNNIQTQIVGLIKMMDMEENSESGWDQFIAHFNDIHPGFFERLKTEFNDLTPNDMKLCAYLRMNLNTKEIATLMNNSVRGVEGGRYRLRKKLNLDSTKNLTDYILNF